MCFNLSSCNNYYHINFRGKKIKPCKVTQQKRFSRHQSNWQEIVINIFFYYFWFVINCINDFFMSDGFLLRETLLLSYCVWFHIRHLFCLWNLYGNRCPQKDKTKSCLSAQGVVSVSKVVFEVWHDSWKNSVKSHGILVGFLFQMLFNGRCETILRSIQGM